MRSYLKYNLLLTALLITVLSGAQNSDSSILENHFLRLRQNIPPHQKMIIVDSIKQILNSYASSDSVFNHRFTNLRFLGQITSPDSTIKLLTWNIILNDTTGKYFCYLIHRPQKGESSKVTYLEAEYKKDAPSSDQIYSKENWYGALYYDVRPFIHKGEECYILLAIDYGNPFITRKIIETLKFDNNGSPQFGVECISDSLKISRRIIFEYASTGVMSLKFEADTLIVFDHLSPFTPDMKGNKMYYGPDFSFDAYVLKNGTWNLMEDIDIRNREKNAIQAK